MGHRESLKFDVLTVACSNCGAKPNRRCVRLVGQRKGQPLKHSHRIRIDDFFKYEANKYGIISEITSNLLYHDMKVRCQISGDIGRIMYISKGDDPTLYIDWQGKQKTIKHSKANDLLKWTN